MLLERVPRPKNADAKATRERILVRASELFAARGKGSTSVRDIARAADVSLATVLHYFGSKDDLYKASIDRMYDEVTELKSELEGVIADADDPAQALDLAVVESYRFARRHLPALRLVMRSVLDTGEVPEERRAGFLMPLLDESAAWLAAITGLPTARVALSLHSLNQLVVRYALIADTEAEWIRDTLGSDLEPQALLEEQLIYVARQLLKS